MGNGFHNIISVGGIVAPPSESIIGENRLFIMTKNIDFS